jgi:hypothetical protein
MIIKGDFQFTEQWGDVVFTDINVDINPVVSQVNPVDMTINVQLTFTVNGNIKGSFAPDINPVPVKDLNYNAGELKDRIIDRLQDFKI